MSYGSEEGRHTLEEVLVDKAFVLLRNDHAGKLVGMKPGKRLSGNKTKI